jgi:hypothetical protein
MLASGTQGRGFKLLDFFTNVKILSMPSFGGEVKESALRHEKEPNSSCKLLDY